MVFENKKNPASLLPCTIIPIIKDNLGDITSSNNYRAVGSLLLKWFNWIILILKEDQVELQVGFKPKSSTFMCSWGILTGLEYYN